MQIRICLKTYFHAYFLKKNHKDRSLQKIERVLTTIDIVSMCMSNFESHTIKIGRKGSLMGIEFMNSHLDFSSLSRLDFVETDLSFFFFYLVLPTHVCIRMCTTRMANFAK